MKVAFLGLGRMGLPMAAHVVRAGHDTSVWNRTPGRAAELVAAGAREAASVSDAVTGADAVVTMLAGPDSVRAVLEDVAAAAPTGTLVVECSTIGPRVARELGHDLKARGLRFVDAPVMGSVGPAADGTLGVLVGGTPEDVAAARPLLELWGDPGRVRHVGHVGEASALKLVSNLTLGVAMAGVGEALRLATDLGVDRAAALDVLAEGPLGVTVGRRREMFQQQEFTPASFTVELMAKDLTLALRAGDTALPLTTAALERARDVLRAGHGGEDYAAMACTTDHGEAEFTPYFSVTLDCADPERLATFYGELVELPVVFRAGSYVVLRPVHRGTGAFIFQRVSDPDRGKSTVHVDLHVRSLEWATDRAVELGGRRGQDVREHGMAWRTMYDPEGNVFCLIES